MCVLLGIFHEFSVDPYYEPLAWFMIKTAHSLLKIVVKQVDVLIPKNQAL